VADVAKEMDLVEQTTYMWLRQDRIERGERDGVTMTEREELEHLRKENRHLRQERDLLKKIDGLLGEGSRPMSRYCWVDSRKAEGFEVKAACKVAGVSTSAYYDFKTRQAYGPTWAEWEEAILINEIIDVHCHLDDTYGSPRVTDELRERGFCVNHKRVGPKTASTPRTAGAESSAPRSQTSRLRRCRTS
jgi:hypothetical protein